jgi:hypothetical protein
MTLEEWINSELRAAFEERLAEHLCPRCTAFAWMSDDRCGICGMTRDQEGPAPIRIDRPVGILTLEAP